MAALEAKLKNPIKENSAYHVLRASGSSNLPLRNHHRAQRGEPTTLAMAWGPPCPRETEGLAQIFFQFILRHTRSSNLANVEDFLYLFIARS